jgi:Transcriptional regulator containing an amidase domain and an AraC-type DNA-binding HTH domain
MLWGDENIRYVFTSVERTIPLYIETIGYSAWERVFIRPDGYPLYHWLHTLEGEGHLELAGGEPVSLTAGMGVLLTPFTPHAYRPVSQRWSTVYVTFGGAAASAILESLNMNVSALYKETGIGSFTEAIGEMIGRAGQDAQFSSLDSSLEMYRFLVLLKKFGMRNNQPSLSQFYDKLRPAVQWMERHLSDNIGLPEIAEQAGMSVSYLSQLFHDAFGISPYSYLIQLRIQSSKRLLITQTDMTMKDIARQTGFNDVSHFVATFRKKEGVTPAKYRELHLSLQEPSHSYHEFPD